MGKRAMAEHHQLLATKLNPGFSAALNNLANAQRERGDVLTAIQNLRTAVKAEPDNPSYELNLASTLAGDQNHAEAALHFKRVTQLDPEHAKAHGALGWSLRVIHEYSAAAKAMTRYASLLAR